MVLKVALGAEGFLTQVTGVVFDAQVALGVVLETGLGTEAVAALLTVPRTLVGVDLHVLLQMPAGIGLKMSICLKNQENN